MMRSIFQCFHMPRFSWIMTECRKAVPGHQGMKAAISTGSSPSSHPSQDVVCPASAEYETEGRNTPPKRPAAGKAIQRSLFGRYHGANPKRSNPNERSPNKLWGIIPCLGNQKGLIPPLAG